MLNRPGSRRSELKLKDRLDRAGAASLVERVETLKPPFAPPERADCSLVFASSGNSSSPQLAQLSESLSLPVFGVAYPHRQIVLPGLLSGSLRSLF